MANFCAKCGAAVGNGNFCTNCGAQLKKLPQVQTNQPPVKKNPHVLSCPRCRESNISIQFIEAGQVMSKKGVGIEDNLHNAGRAIAAVGTFGISNLFIRKAEGRNTVKTVTKKMALCQSCGHSWEIK